MTKYKVTLTAEERAALQQLVAVGKAAARKLTHARIHRPLESGEVLPHVEEQLGRVSFYFRYHSARLVPRPSSLSAQRELTCPVAHALLHEISCAGVARLIDFSIAVIHSALIARRRPASAASIGLPLRRGRVAARVPRKSQPALRSQVESRRSRLRNPREHVVSQPRSSRRSLPFLLRDIVTAAGWRVTPALRRRQAAT